MVEPGSRLLPTTQAFANAARGLLTGCCDTSTVPNSLITSGTEDSHQWAVADIEWGTHYVDLMLHGIRS